MQSRNPSEMFEAMREQFENDLLVGTYISQKIFAETTQLLQAIADQKSYPPNPAPRLFRAIKYSTKKECYKERLFLEDEQSTQRQQREGTAREYTLATTPSVTKYFFSRVTAARGFLHEDSHYHSIALAVIGGNHFRRMLGKTLPQYYLALDPFNETKKNHYRIAKEIPPFIEFSDYDKLKPYPIYGFFINFILAYYFADFDIALNIVLLEGKNHYLISKFDPEHCFTSDYERNTKDDIVEHLRFLFHSSTDYQPEKIELYKDMESGEEKVFMIYGSDTPSFFRTAFDSAPFLCVELFQKLYFSPQRNQELFIALAIILDTDPHQLKEDVDAVLGPENSRFKQSILEANEKRYQYFKEAAFMLEGFPHYYLTKAYEQDEIYQLYKGCDGEARCENSSRLR